MSNKELHLTPAKITLAVHFPPISPFGNLAWCFNLGLYDEVFRKALGVGLSVLFVPVCPSTGTELSLNQPCFALPRPSALLLVLFVWIQPHQAWAHWYMW